MRRTLSLCPLLFAVGLLLAAHGPPPAQAQAEAASPFAGTWKVSILVSGRGGPVELNFFLVKLEGKGDKVTGSVVATAPQVKGAKLKDVSANASSVRFVLATPAEVLPSVFYALKGKSEQLRGTVLAGDRYLLARLSRTKDTEIEKEAAVTPVAGFEEFRKAMSRPDEKERDAALEALLKKEAGKPLAWVLTQALVSLKVRAKAKADEVKPFAEQNVKLGASHGREGELEACFQMFQTLGRSKATAGLGLEYGDRAAALLRDTDPPGLAVKLLRSVTKSALRAGKGKEAEALAARLGKFQGRVNLEAVEQARASLKRLAEGSNPRARLFFLKRLSAALKRAGQEAEVKKVDEQIAKLRKDAVGDRKDRKEQLKAALEQARERVKELEKDATARQREVAYKALATALRRNGKVAEAKEHEAKVAKLREQLDREQVKKGLPFKPEPFAGRKGKQDHVVLLELFTGAQCPPCVGPDMAFDGLVKSFKPSEVVLLQYHLHIPGPDPLTNADSEARAEYYGDDVGGTPSLFIDGEVVSGVGGYAEHAGERYTTLRADLQKELAVPAHARVALSVERKGDKVQLTATASLAAKAANARLRLVLIEDEVSWAGGNGLRLHHHVVRAMPGGPAGTRVGLAEAKVKEEVDLAALRKSLVGYLERYEEEEREFFSNDWPLELKHLKVVAFVQDDNTRQVLQAVQVDVPAAKE